MLQLTVSRRDLLAFAAAAACIGPAFADEAGFIVRTAARRAGSNAMATDRAASPFLR